MTTLVEDRSSSLQAPDLMGTLQRVAEFGKDAGKRLRAARENLGLSQFEAAVKLDVTEKTVGKWERGQAKPTRNGHWNRIEDVYGISRREILGEPEPEQLDRIERELAELRAELAKFLEAVSPSASTAERRKSGRRPKPPLPRSSPEGKSEPPSRRRESG